MKKYAKGVYKKQKLFIEIMFPLMNKRPLTVSMKISPAPQKELPKRKIYWKFTKIIEMIISVFTHIK